MGQEVPGNCVKAGGEVRNFRCIRLEFPLKLWPGLWLAKDLARPGCPAGRKLGPHCVLRDNLRWAQSPQKPSQSRLAWRRVAVRAIGRRAGAAYCMALLFEHGEHDLGAVSEG